MNKVFLFIGLLLCLTISIYGETKNTGRKNFGQLSNYNETNAITVASKSKEYKNNPYYQSFNFHRCMAIGFGVPGLLLLTTPVLFGTAPLFIACAREGYSWVNISNNDVLVIGISYYFISIGIGTIFTAISAVNLVLAVWQLKKWKNAGDSVSLSLGYQEGPLLAVSYKF